VNDAEAPYLILALGRARTTWLARLLTYRGWLCDHDQAPFMRSVGDVARFFAQPCHGSAETAAAPGWELIRFLAPDLRTVVIRRPLDEVIASFLAIDLKGVAMYDEAALRRNMTRLDRALERVAGQRGVLVVAYEDLGQEDTCKAVWEHCLPHPWSRTWYEAWKDRNIQCDTLAQVLYHHAHSAEIATFKTTIGREMRTLARARLIERGRSEHAR
jgi:hypothetical protein